MLIYMQCYVTAFGVVALKTVKIRLHSLCFH